MIYIADTLQGETEFLKNLLNVQVLPRRRRSGKEEEEDSLPRKTGGGAGSAESRSSGCIFNNVIYEWQCAADSE